MPSKASEGRHWKEDSVSSSRDSAHPVTHLPLVLPEDGFITQTVPERARVERAVSGGKSSGPWEFFGSQKAMLLGSNIVVKGKIPLDG